MDRGAWWATVHGVSESWTWLSNYHTHSIKSIGLNWWLSGEESACQCRSSVQFSRSVVSASLRPHESQHARPPCPSPTPGVHSDSRPSSQWCHPGSIPGSGRSPGIGNGNLLQFSCWEIPWAEKPGGLQSMGSQSQMWLKWLSMYLCTVIEDIFLNCLLTGISWKFFTVLLLAF